MKTLVYDLQYGDTGKGRVSAFFGKDADWFIRFNGANNAGHTVYSDNQVYKLHHLPAGAVLGKKIALDSGMLINLEDIKNEIKEINRPIDIYVSENVNLITKEHLERDSQGSNIGTTKKGIAYAYSDMALRCGKRIGDLNIDYLRSFIPNCKVYRGLPPIALNENSIFESAQGLMLDLNYGNWPCVTSSSIFPSSVHRIDKFIGVIKAYTSRVGSGPPNWPDLPEIRNLGKEYGTTTGRPRKCCWNDIAQINYSISVSSPDEIVVTRLDILRSVQEIKVYENNQEKIIGNLDSYKDYLLQKFPQIKWFSESPYGDLIKVR